MLDVSNRHNKSQGSWFGIGFPLFLPPELGEVRA